MYSFEQHVRVMLQFRAMDAPVEISVPWNVLFYLDMHAERSFAADGTVVYRHIRETEPGRRAVLAAMSPACSAA
jgi:hypothetical protein